MDEIRRPGSAAQPARIRPVGKRPGRGLEGFDSRENESQGRAGFLFRRSRFFVIPEWFGAAKPEEAWAMAGNVLETRAFSPWFTQLPNPFKQKLKITFACKQRK